MEKIKEVYEYRWPNDKSRFAHIEKTSSKEINVRFFGVCQTYDQDDWQFLHDLSVEVLKMYAQEKYCYDNGKTIEVKLCPSIPQKHLGKIFGYEENKE